MTTWACGPEAAGSRVGVIIPLLRARCPCPVGVALDTQITEYVRVVEMFMFMFSHMFMSCIVSPAPESVLDVGTEIL